MKRLVALFPLLLLSCGDVQTGGFETTDLHAHVARPDGTPVVSARVWLVRSAGPTSPATAIDSGFTDASGTVRFPLPTSGSAGLGVDATWSDSVGLSPLSLESSSTATVVLGAAHQVSIPSDSTGSARCFVPGSHFSSTLQADGATASLWLPSGTWDLAVERGGTTSIRRLVLAADTILGSSLPASLDTSSPGGATLLAGRIQSQSLDGLGMQVLNTGTTSLDSLALRIYLEGTSAELSDFRARLDLAQVSTAGGFNKPAGLDGSLWTSFRPQAMGGDCPGTSVCTWKFDLPLEGVVVEAGGRLEISFLFTSTEAIGSRPVHDPFSGTDWSFRTRTWSDSATNPRNLPDYAGVPVVPSSDTPPAAPYMALLRGRRLLAGNPPSDLW